MNDASAVGPIPDRRPDPIRRLRWLVPLALVVIALVIVSVTQTLHDSVKPAAGDQPTVGFFQPKDTTPVSFSLPVLQSVPIGRHVSMDSLIGKPLVINMWASTCSVCMSETSAMEAVATRLAGRVNFVGIDTFDGRAPAMAFVAKYHVTYRQLFDPQEHVGSGYGIFGLPVTVFVTAGGKVVGENLGALDVASLSRYLKLLFGINTNMGR
jgi:thiol-disulfide isomerase/thioredoxin